jgi:tRNA pseudouridine55 synthase
MTQTLDIILNINKPLHWTSFDVCNALKRNYPRKTKIGHAGTLDPLASGVLIIAIGKATKKIESLQSETKQYLAEVTLGATTITYDAENYPEVINNTSAITKDQILQSLTKFEGEIEQLPPIYSALKIDGKRAYDLARKGEEVILKKRKIEINSIVLKHYECNEGITKFSILVTCSKGTYIRSLAHDIGQELGVGAFLSGLIRTASGDYKVEDALDISSLVTVKY